MPPIALRPPFPQTSSLLLRTRPLTTPFALPSSTTPQHTPHPLNTAQLRHATYIKRPRRPYTFTQLLTLSDGSTFLHRTTSPAPVYKSTKDTRNTPLWNPSSQKLATVEEDEAGRLRGFRRRFGRGWDAGGRRGTGSGDVESEAEEVVDGGRGGARDAALEAEGGVVPGSLGKGGRREILIGGSNSKTAGGEEAGDAARENQGTGDNLMDLISTFGQGEAQQRVEKAMAGGAVKRSGKSSGR